MRVWLFVKIYWLPKTAKDDKTLPYGGGNREISLKSGRKKKIITPEKYVIILNFNILPQNRIIMWHYERYSINIVGFK